MCTANAVVEGPDAATASSEEKIVGPDRRHVALAMAVGVAPLSPTKFDPFALIG